MATYCANVLISELRKQKGLSQEKLSDGICDRRTISYIETGKISPSKYLFEHLMQRLGVDADRFSCFISSKAEMHFEEIKDQISQLFKEKKHDQVLELITEIENDKYFENNKFIKQYALKIRAWVLAGGMDWHNASNSELPKMLLEAISLTINSFDFENIKTEIYSLIEIDLIRMYGLYELYNGKKEKALNIFKALEAIINLNYIYLNDIAGTYASLLVSLAKCYRWLNNYDEALLASERGLNMCIRSHSYRSIPWLLYQKASALYHLKNKSEALNLLNEAIIISKHYQEMEFIEFLNERKNHLESGKF